MEYKLSIPNTNKLVTYVTSNWMEKNKRIIVGGKVVCSVAS
jgi:hypothetical protein